MNKGIKITLCCCLILLIVGAALTVAGIAMGAKMNYTERELETVFEHTELHRFIERID